MGMAKSLVVSRSLPPAWSNLAMTMRTNPEIDTLSIDDLYNNLRVFEQEIQGASKTSSSAQNVAFVSQSKSSTNKVKSGFTGAYSTCTPSTSSTNIPEKEVLAGFADEVIYSLFAKQSEDWDLLHEDLEQIDDVDIEEMDINWQIAMIAIRMKKFYKKTGRRVRVDGKTPVGFDKKKLECFNCHNTGHFARECTAKGTHDGKKKRDSFYQHQEAGKQEKNQMGLLTMDDGIVNWGEHTEVEETNHALMAISSSNEVTLCSKTCIDSYNTLKTLCDEQMNQLGDQEAQILAYSQAVKKLEAQLVTFQKQQLSLNEKLTFQANEIYEKDEKLKRYRRIGMKAVKEKEQLQKTLDSWKDSSKNLWRLINSGMSSNSKVGLGFEIQSNNEVLSYEEEMNFSVFNCSKEDSVGKPLYSRFTKTNDFKGKGPQEPEPNVSDDRSSEYSTCQSNDSEGSIRTSSEHSVDLESEISSVPPEVYVSTPITSNEKGEGYSFTKKKCFVCGSVSHLIKDCDYYEKKMAREAEVKKQRVVNSGNGVAKPVWTNANRVNHANKLVPRSVQINAGRPNINSVMPNINTGRININSVRPNINTGKTNINPVRPRVNTASSNVNTVRTRQSVPTKTSNNFSPKRPHVNKFNQRGHFSKSYPSVRRPFANTTAQMSHFHVVKGNWGSAVKTSAGYNWRNSKPNSNCDSGPTFIRTVNAKGPQGRPKPKKAWVTRINWRILKNSMGSVLWKVAKHKVLFTETECLVVSSDFKMPDENQILLKVPRHHNMYSFDMKTPTPAKGFACLIAKATSDESKLWHRRLGFQNDHTSVAAIGTQHRASAGQVLQRKLNNAGYFTKLQKSNASGGKKYEDQSEDINQELIALRSLISKQQRKITKITALFVCQFSTQEELKRIAEALQDDSWVQAMQEELLQFKLQQLWMKRFMSHNLLVFVDPDHPNKVYKVVKALYGLHQAPRAWDKKDIMLVQVKQEQGRKSSYLTRQDVDEISRNLDLVPSCTLTALRPVIMYALTSNPTIYDSLVKQFWQTATTNTIADGTLEIHATIDTIGYTITEASIRDTLQLADATGITMLPKIGKFLRGWGNVQSPPPIPASIPTPTPIPETKPTPIEHTFEEPSPVHQHFSPTQEQAQGQMAMDDLLHLVKKLRSWKGFERRKCGFVRTLKKEEPKAQGRKSQDDPLASLVQGLVTPSMTKVNASGEEQVEDIRVNTGSIKISTVSEQVSTDSAKRSIPSPDKGQRVGKAPMISEETPKNKDVEPAKKSGKRRKQMARKGLHRDLDKDDSEGSDEVSKQDDSVSGTKIPINPVPVAMKSLLYRIVMNRYGMDGLEDELEKVFWKYLKNMFEEPLSTDPICVVRKYPLSAEICKTMLNKKLQGGKPDEDCYKMLKMMEKQAGIRK
ncbi:ribonuclease H-like domain-containing protein [Tanacetum coccineum]